MTRLETTQRLSAGRLAAGRAARRWTSRLLASPALSWRYGAAIADRLILQPQDLREIDPAFASELASGSLRLGSTVARVDHDQPFDQPHLTDAERAELHGFGWLRHLKAVGSVGAQAEARRLITAWLDHGGDRSGLRDHDTIDVLARRLSSWLSVADFVAAGSADDTLDHLLDGVALARIALAAHWRSAHVGWPRLQSVIALALYDTVIDGRDGERERSFARLRRELRAQTTEDGGALSRNADDTLEMVLDLASLNLALVTRGLDGADVIRGAMRSAVAVLRRTRLGDGTLARFNGVRTALVLTDRVLRWGIDPAAATDAAAEPVVRSGYARLARGDTIMVVDVAPPPPIGAATRAGAGCLAFELSVGRQRILGTACPIAGHGAPVDTILRSTAAHATLTLAGQSSSSLVSLGQRAGRGRPPVRSSADGHAIVGPQTVHVDATPAATGDAVISASHDGYVPSHGLWHTRRVTLSVSGDRIVGVDRLGDRNGTVRLKQDAPFAAYFHVEPGVEVTLLSEDHAAELAWSNANRAHTWRFSATGPVGMSLEAAPGGGPRGQIAIVLRGATFGDTEFTWTLQRVAPDAQPTADLAMTDAAADPPCDPTSGT